MHPTRQPIMAANWKMYKTIGDAKDFCIAFKQLVNALPVGDLPDIVICPPFTALYSIGSLLTEPSIMLGAQNMASVDEGACTGEVSPVMLTDLKVSYVILGHSERREYFGEQDADIHAKILTALKHGITPIVCVGESLVQRQSGKTDAWIERQVECAIHGLSEVQRTAIVFAYEPIWAIGTGKVCEAPEANRVIGLIRRLSHTPSMRILYGGSMKPDNVEGLMSQPEIDGGLVGGASLDPQSFFELVKAAMPLKVQHV